MAQHSQALIDAERSRFLDTALTTVRIKTWPWVKPEAFGSVDMVPVHAGEPVVVQRDDGDQERFGDLDAFLERWCGD